MYKKAIFFCVQLNKLKKYSTDFDESYKDIVLKDIKKV